LAALWNPQQQNFEGRIDRLLPFFVPQILKKKPLFTFFTSRRPMVFFSCLNAGFFVALFFFYSNLQAASNPGACASARSHQNKKKKNTGVIE
jgi:hypothetical protein